MATYPYHFNLSEHMQNFKCIVILIYVIYRLDYHCTVSVLSCQLQTVLRLTAAVCGTTGQAKLPASYLMILFQIRVITYDYKHLCSLLSLDLNYQLVKVYFLVSFPLILELIWSYSITGSKLQVSKVCSVLNMLLLYPAEPQECTETQSLHHRQQVKGNKGMKTRIRDNISQHVKSITVNVR